MLDTLNPEPAVAKETLSTQEASTAAESVDGKREDKHDFNPQVRTDSDHDSDVDSEGFTRDAQQGVVAIEATTTVWTKQDLILAYVL